MSIKNCTFTASPRGTFDPAAPVVPTLAEVQRAHVLHVLRLYDGHRVKAARALGVGRRTLGMWLKEWGLIEGR